MTYCPSDSRPQKQKPWRKIAIAFMIITVILSASLTVTMYQIHIKNTSYIISLRIENKGEGESSGYAYLYVEGGLKIDGAKFSIEQHQEDFVLFEAPERYEGKNAWISAAFGADSHDRIDFVLRGDMQVGPLRVC